jgi:peptide/nickel transport system substrate-binding protein/oligopeptide transport system substrate-binding protein
MEFRLTTLFPLAFLLGILSGCGGPGETRLERFSSKLQDRLQTRKTRFQGLSRRLDQVEAESYFLEGYLQGITRRGGAPARNPGLLSGLDSEPSQVAPPESRSQGPRFGGSYRLALSTDPPTLDPVRIEDTTSFSVAIQIMEGLLEFDRDMNLVPVLAKSWSVSPDKRTYTFELHSGVRFHHGREMTAEDFVYSIGRNLDPRALGVRAYLFDRILGYPLFAALRRVGRAAGKSLAGENTDSEALMPDWKLLQQVDGDFLERRRILRSQAVLALVKGLLQWKLAPQKTSRKVLQGLVARTKGLSVWDFLRRGLRAPAPQRFVVELAEPFAPFVWNLPMVNAAVVPREEVERLGADFAFRPVGTGPFRLNSWKHDVGLTLEASEDYFRGRPYLDRIEYRILADPVTRLVEYQVGNLDSIHQLPDEKYLEIKADPPGELIEFPLLHVFYLGMNASQPPFDDVRVRRAFNHAINKRLILEKIKKGRGVVARGPLPPAFKAYDPALRGYDYDPQKARVLLKEAGYGPENPLRGVPLWFNTATGADANAKIAEVVQGDLREVGVELALEGMAWGTYLDRVHRCEAPLFRLAWLPSHPNGDSILYALFRSGSASNACCYQNAQVDQWLDLARSEHEEARRMDLYRRVQRQIVEDAAWIPLYHARQEVLKRPWVRDLPLNARGMEAARLRGVWLDR